MLHLYDQIQAATKHLKPLLSNSPKVGMILGTGLGGLAKQITNEKKIASADIPHFPRSTVESHAGNLVSGDLAGVPVLAMEGRFHYYEGYSLQEVTLPVRVMQALGCELLIVTCAAGGINPQYHLADIMVIEDHINLHADNPLRGVNDDRLGPRFPDMCEPYSKKLLELSRKNALALGLPLNKGVLVSVQGPNLETRAEYRMLKMMGADAVAMSTVPEVIIAKHAGLDVLGFAVITDLCLPDALEPVELPKIIEMANIGGTHLAKLIPQVLQDYFHKN
jgi:purine-nucleoside phosphorylase